MTTTCFSHRKRRSAQALLIAVVVMLFVALISAGFLATVTGNLNQSAREGDKARAAEAARAGLKFINDRLESHADGENWRPQNGVPVATDANYYNDLMRAQGWAGKFARFPDPRVTNADVRGDDSAQFLARVERIGYNVTQRRAEGQATLLSDPEATRAGALKITVVGLSKRDPNAFSRIVAYRGGYNAAPVGRAMRVVSNWDFKNKTVPSARVQTGATIPTTTLQIASRTGEFPAKNFAVLIGNPDVGAALRGAVVTDFDSATNTLTLAQPLTFAAGERVELAAPLGAPTGLDFNRNATLEAGETVTFPVSENANPGSARINGSGWIFGDVRALNLHAQNSAIPAGQAPGKIAVSGLLSNTATLQISGTDRDGNTVPPTNLVADSNAANFPFALGTEATRDSLVSDGFARLREDVSSERQTAPFSPPDLLSRENQARYLGLTRDSASNDSAFPEASNNGYGKGIFINNFQDREKIFDGARLREMTQTELLDLWFSTDTTNPYFRLGAPKISDPNVDTNGNSTPDVDEDTNGNSMPDGAEASLEEQHLRGWVGRDEFRARGVLIELFNDAGDGNKPKLAITRDARGDNTSTDTTRALGPVPDKAWRAIDGTLQNGVYRQIFDISDTTRFNGTIYAQGNVRIVGEATGLPQSLTVVSLGNIYIEGNLGADDRKVLLLARKNVVMNPTRVLGRPDAQTAATASVNLTPGTPAVLPVGDSVEFRLGDVVEVGTSGRALVNSIPSATTLNLRNLGSAPISVASGERVVSAPDTVLNGASVIRNGTDALIRRVNVPLAANGMRVLLDHRADRVPGLEVGVNVTGTPPTNVWLTNKRNTTAGTIASTDKFIGADYGTTERFPATDPADDTAADANTIQAVASQMNSSGHGGDWNYTTTTTHPTVPLHYLAGVGLLPPYTPPTVARPGADILSTPFEIPLAVSVGVSLGGTPANLTDSNGAATSQIGFNPLWSGNEDATTVDQSFYGTTNTLDSRAVGNAALGAGQSNLVLRQSDGLIGLSPLLGLPTYHASALKLENLGTAGEIEPAATLNVKAFVYAQTGSWLVIPGGDFALSSRFKGDESASYYDANSNNAADAGEYVDTDGNNAFNAGDAADFNHNGTRETGEFIALSDNMKRFARYNTQIIFTGAIAENHTALVSDAGSVRGQVARWMDQWATYSTAAAGWKNISYSFDSAFVTGNLESDPGFRMPLADDILVVS